MKPCKSLIIANEVLEKLINNAVLEDCWYSSCYSGGPSIKGLCGYTIYGKVAQNNIKLIFYGISKGSTALVQIFMLVNGKSKVHGEQFNVEDAVKFIVLNIDKFMVKMKRKQ